MSEADNLFDSASEAEDKNGMAARAAALEILGQVTQRKQPLDQALEQSEAFARLSQRDRAFVRMLVTTAIRRLGQVDDLIDKALERDMPTNLTLVNILRLGVTQIAFMDVPDHAAVDTAVRLAEENRLGGQKGFINAMLRTITRVGREWIGRQDEGRLNTPEWLLKIWIEDYGIRAAADIAKANLSEAPLDITIKDQAKRSFWGAELRATQMPSGTMRRIGGGAVKALPGFGDGAWWVQDASAALPALLLGEIEGQRVYDLCAAPGGKTLQLAAFGAQVTALDRSAKRLKRLEENLARMALEAEVSVQVGDAAKWKPGEPAAYILLDAPCSATGTVRRHPDVVHLKTPRDIERLSHVQKDLLDNAFANLMPGGVLVYCTCSLQKAEGEGQIEALLAREPSAQRLPIVAAELGGWDEAITDAGDLRILPYHQAALGGMDGFYISRLTKGA